MVATLRDENTKTFAAALAAQTTVQDIINGLTGEPFGLTDADWLNKTKNSKLDQSREIKRFDDGSSIDKIRIQQADAFEFTTYENKRGDWRKIKADSRDGDLVLFREFSDDYSFKYKQYDSVLDTPLEERKIIDAYEGDLDKLRAFTPDGDTLAYRYESIVEHSQTFGLPMYERSQYFYEEAINEVNGSLGEYSFKNVDGEEKIHTEAFVREGELHIKSYYYDPIVSGVLTKEISRVYPADCSEQANCKSRILREEIVTYDPNLRHINHAKIPDLTGNLRGIELRDYEKGEATFISQRKVDGNWQEVDAGPTMDAFTGHSKKFAMRSYEEKTQYDATFGCLDDAELATGCEKTTKTWYFFDTQEAGTEDFLNQLDDYGFLQQKYEESDITKYLENGGTEAEFEAFVQAFPERVYKAEFEQSTPGEFGFDGNPYPAIDRVLLTRADGDRVISQKDRYWAVDFSEESILSIAQPLSTNTFMLDRSSLMPGNTTLPMTNPAISVDFIINACEETHACAGEELEELVGLVDANQILPDGEHITTASDLDKALSVLVGLEGVGEYFSVYGSSPLFKENYLIESGDMTWAYGNNLIQTQEGSGFTSPSNRPNRVKAVFRDSVQSDISNAGETLAFPLAIDRYAVAEDSGYTYLASTWESTFPIARTNDASVNYYGLSYSPRNNTIETNKGQGGAIPVDSTYFTWNALPGSYGFNNAYLRSRPAEDYAERTQDGYIDVTGDGNGLVLENFDALGRVVSVQTFSPINPASEDGFYTSPFHFVFQPTTGAILSGIPRGITHSDDTYAPVMEVVDEYAGQSLVIEKFTRNHLSLDGMAGLMSQEIAYGDGRDSEYYWYNRQGQLVAMNTGVFADTHLQRSFEANGAYRQTEIRDENFVNLFREGGDIYDSKTSYLGKTTFIPAGVFGKENFSQRFRADQMLEDFLPYRVDLDVSPAQSLSRAYADSSQPFVLEYGYGWERDTLGFDCNLGGPTCSDNQFGLNQITLSYGGQRRVFEVSDGKIVDNSALSAWVASVYGEEIDLNLPYWLNISALNAVRQVGLSYIDPTLGLKLSGTMDLRDGFTTSPDKTYRNLWDTSAHKDANQPLNIEVMPGSALERIFGMLPEVGRRALSLKLSEISQGDLNDDQLDEMIRNILMAVFDQLEPSVGDYFKQLFAEVTGIQTHAASTLTSALDKLDNRTNCEYQPISGSGDQQALVCVSTDHKYINEFHESSISFNNIPGGAYEEVFKCLCSTSTLEHGNHDLSVAISGFKGSKLIDAYAWRDIVQNNGAPGAGSVTALDDLRMNKGAFKTDNPIFSSEKSLPHYLLVSKTIGQDKRPVASLQVKVYNAKFAREGDAVLQKPDVLTQDGLENFSSTYQGPHGGTATWQGRYIFRYETDKQHTQIGHYDWGLRIPESATWPFGPNADGSCNADSDFSDFEVARQACKAHPILGIALSSSPREMAASYNLKVEVRGAASISH